MGTGIANARTVQWGQMTPAQQVLAQLLNKGRGTSTTRRRRKKKAASKPRRRRATAKRGKRGARLVKGSAAAKRYMAKIRRMRKKR